MKTLLITVLLATAANAKIGVECKTSEAVCNTNTECCGKATKDPLYKDGSVANFAKDGVIRTICHAK